MSFSRRDLRRGMDVFSADGGYLGTVVQVRRDAPSGNRSPTPVAEGARASAPRAAGAGRAGAGRSPSANAVPAFSGEGLGPVPTTAVGNRGPGCQSAATGYASAPPTASAGAGAHQPAELLVLRLLTMLDWSTLRPRLRRIPVSLVQSVSMERIVLSCTAAELDVAGA